jgi:hypothetical protein
VLIMVLTDFTITAADVGRALGVPDGYLVNLVMTQGPAHETPSVDEGKQKLTSGYFVLRGSRDWRDLVCVSRICAGPAEWLELTGNMVVSGGIRYSGDLVVVAVPRGSQWSLTLSDIPMGDKWRGSP